MRLGVFLLAGRFPGQTDGEALQRALAVAEAADAAGLDDVWIAEHHFMPYGVCPSAITFAAHALGRTRRATIGTAVSVLSTTHPVALAEQTALLDQLADGRFVLGVGRGGPWVDLEVFGTGLQRWDQGFADGLDLLLATLEQPTVAAAGDHFSFREVPVVPRPATEPRPPVAVACTSPETVDIAAERGLPMLLGMHIGDDDKLAMVDRYDVVAEKAGRDPTGAPHVSVVVAHLAPSRDQARRELLDTMPPYLAAGFAAHTTVDGRPGPSRDPHAYAEMLCDLHPVGTAQQCVEHLRRSAERSGIDHVVMMVEGSGSHARTLENVAALASDVLPHVR